MKPTGQQQIRYYVHGDEREGDPYSFYCASCDLFVPLTHFDDTRHVKSRGTKYEQSLRNWRGISKNYPGKYRRPTNPKNWVADDSAADKRKAIAARSKFFVWLRKQGNRDDPIGDLSTDCQRDQNFPVEVTDNDRLRRYLRHNNACNEALVALDEALQEFALKPRVRKGLSLALRFSIFQDDDYCCRLCGNSAKDGARLEVDHKVAVASGGTNERTNLWTLCFECNRGKSANKL